MRLFQQPQLEGNQQMKTHLTKFVLTLISIIVMTSLSAEASNVYSNLTILVRVHFSNEFYGEPVESVKAHLGVLSGANWLSVQDLKLEEKNGHFFAKTKINYQHESVYGKFDGVKVAYLIQLKNGQSQWTTPASIPLTEWMRVYEGCNDPKNPSCLSQGVGDTMFNAFNSSDDSLETFATVFSTYH